MSCQIKGIANLTNTSNIKELLFGDSIKRPDIPQDELPLQDCFISLSSTGDVLAMAYNTKMIILISRWDSLEPDEAKNKFHMIWYGEVAKEENEWITSVICLPLLSLGKASGGTNPDWTCIIVGFNTGFIRFYTETGALLLGEQLHNESVLGLKCQSLRSPKHTGDTGLIEEVHVTYNSVVCVLQGFSLFSTLRACRNHLARVQANCDDLPPTTNLSYKKWGYKSQDIVNDSEVIGTTSVNSFDHLMTASICGGYNASYRSSAPQHNLVLATGKRPFIGFHYALEGGSAPVLSDVAIAMASKLANAIGTAVPSWLPLNWGNSKHQTSLDATKTIAHEPVEPMTCRFGLSDVTREGYSIVSSPNKVLSVVLDAMGRVLLVDNRSGIATRMWKGYRDAQCGWIEVEEEKHSGMHKVFSKFKQPTQLRTALFLVIYAPKKGVIDIWSTQQGPKITTFTASKHGRLLYINYGLLGVNDNVHLSRNKPQYSCVFMDPLGGLKEITVPFHFALNSKNGKRARDIHLLKKLKTFLREEEFEHEKLVLEIENVCSELKTNEIKVQMLEMLMSNKHITPDALLAATNSFNKKLDEYEEEETESTAKTIYLMTTQLQQVIKFYKHVKSQFDTAREISLMNDNDNEINSKNLASILLTSEREVHRILELFDKVNSYRCLDSRTECKVKFKEDGKVFLDFLSCFEFGTPGLINLKKNIKSEKEHEISRLMYEGCIYSYDRIETWKEAANCSNIEPFIFMRFGLIYWLNRKQNKCLEVELKQFMHLLNAICSVSSIEEICTEHNEVSSWCKKVCNILFDSTNVFNALTAALVCRAVAMSVEKHREKCMNKIQVDKEENDTNNENDSKEELKQHQDCVNNVKQEDEVYNLTSEWENVTKDVCQFTLLIGNLEDITMLDAIVSQQLPLDDTTQFFALPFVKSDISLGSVLSKGKGSVSEIVAKWIVSTGIDPAQLIDTTDTEFDQIQSTNEILELPNSSDEVCDADPQFSLEKPDLESIDPNSEDKDSTNATKCILERIQLLKRHFPYSLTSSILLANVCWEFAMSWNKDISQLKSLEAALSVVQQIPMKHMRHGVCCLLWSVHIKKRMEAVSKLINKLGKLPKEKLCMQEIGLTDIQTVVFLQNCVTFLDIFIDSEVLEAGMNSVIKSEELWEGYTSGPQPFAALAIFQAPAWYDLIMLHVQLANVLYMIAHFNLKVTKPLNNLFESVAQPYFFQTMSDKVMLTWYRDDKRDSLRMNFLCRVISASMDFIHQETTDDKMISSTQAFQWMSKCQMLASIWKINSDELRIYQVCQFYVNGFDRLAEEIVTAVNDVEKLATDLLPVAGRRMMSYFSKAPDLLNEISRISPTLMKYLESLDSPGVICTNCSNYDTIELIRRVARDLPETHSNYHLAQLLLDAAFIFEGT